MKKRAFVSAILLLSALALSAAVPHIDFKQTQQGDIQIQDRTLFLNSGQIWLRQHTRDGKKAIGRKWGEYFLGLQFGQASDNGGWNKWDFFCCWEMVKNPGTGKTAPVDLTREFIPESVTVNSIQGIAVADLIFPSANGKGRLKMRLMQFPSHPEWTFAKVTAENFSPWRLDFSAYPCSAKALEGEERYVGTRLKRHNLTAGQAELTSGETELAFYKKFTNDHAGNFLLLEPEKIRKITFWGGKSAAVTARMMTEPGQKEFHFALGYFWNKPAETAVNKFLTEDADAIRQFMNQIDWNPQMQPEQIEKCLADAAGLGVEQKKLQDIRKCYDAACGRKDPAAMQQILNELELLKKAATDKGLNQFK